MQLMPATAADLEVQDPFDPRDNIDGGTRYLSKLLLEFEGDLDLATAAYNAGPQAVYKYGGVPPYDETQEYVRRVRILYRRYNDVL
jgi:soluble lytic murein transglycosylase-like protein